jgi:hypothetical protein
MSITRSRASARERKAGLRAGQYDGPTIGIRAKSLPLYRRVWSPVTARRSGKGGKRSALGQLPGIVGLQLHRQLGADVSPLRE